jgi:D-glycero-D-manno-heptose 1,7-bisphosphate phosphatase
LTSKKRSAVFLDRDGTLIVDRGYLRDPAGIEFLPGALESLAGFQRVRLALVVVSNQSGVGRGIMTAEEANRVAEHFLSLLTKAGIRLDGVYYCPHAPDSGCTCRKPLPGMLMTAAKKLSIDLESSVMVGDKPSDVLAGQAAGCRTVLFAAGPVDETSCQPDWVTNDWRRLKKLILSAGLHGGIEP